MNFSGHSNAKGQHTLITEYLSKMVGKKNPSKSSRSRTRVGLNFNLLKRKEKRESFANSPQPPQRPLSPSYEDARASSRSNGIEFKQKVRQLSKQSQMLFSQILQFQCENLEEKLKARTLIGEFKLDLDSFCSNFLPRAPFDLLSNRKNRSKKLFDLPYSSNPKTQPAKEWIKK